MRACVNTPKTTLSVQACVAVYKRLPHSRSHITTHRRHEFKTKGKKKNIFVDMSFVTVITYLIDIAG